MTTAQGASAGQLVVPAVPNPVPVSPKRVQDAVIAAGVGLLLGMGFALLRDYVDDRIRDVDDLEEAAGGLPTIGLVPALPEWRDRKTPFLVTARRPRSPAAEAYRALRTSIKFMALENPVTTLQVTSPGATEGKTTTSANLAYAMAESGQQVVLVDCDLRRPRVHEFFHLPNEVGLTSVLLGEAAVEEVLLPVQGDDGTDGLLVLTSGPIPPNPSELLSGASAELLFKQLAESADMVILDSSPVLPGDRRRSAGRPGRRRAAGGSSGHLDRSGADALARAAGPGRRPCRRHGPQPGPRRRLLRLRLPVRLRLDLRARPHQRQREWERQRQRPGGTERQTRARSRPTQDPLSAVGFLGHPALSARSGNERGAAHRPRACSRKLT